MIAENLSEAVDPSTSETAVVLAGDYLNKLTGEKIERECKRRLASGVKTIVVNFAETQIVNSIGVSILLGVIDAARVDEAPPLERIAVAVDPGGSQHLKADHTGLVAAGRAGNIHTGHGYVLEDDTAKHTWDGWGDRAYVLAEKHGASVFVIDKSSGKVLRWSFIRESPAARCESMTTR